MLRKIFGVATLLALMLCMVSGSIYATGNKSPNSKETINLDKDDNGDGIPDELLNEVTNIEAAVEKVQTSDEKSRDKAVSDLKAKVDDLNSRLPYSEETRTLQQQLTELQQKLKDNKSDKESKKILKDIDAVVQKMMADSNYAKVVNALPKILALFPVSPFPAEDQSKIDKSNATKDARGADFSRLDKGDITLVYSASSSGLGWSSFLYALDYSHAGVYDNNQIYSSNTKSGGVTFESMNEWKKKGYKVGLAFNNRTTYNQDTNALSWAEGKWKTNSSTKYNYNFADKNTDSKLYCSQLVWKVQKRNNIDVDSNDGWYLASVYVKWGVIGWGIALSGVAPDEIARSSNVTIYSKGTN